MFGSKSKKMMFDKKKLRPQQPAKDGTAAPPAEGYDFPEDDLPIEPMDINMSVDDLYREITAGGKAGKPPKAPKPPKPKREKDPFKLPLWKNKRVLGLTLMVGSLLVTLVISPTLSYFSAPSTANAVTATVDIEVGTLITKEMVSDTVRNAQAILPMQELRSDLVIGKYACSKIVASELVSTPKLTDSIPLSNGYLHALPSGKKAMSISVSKLSFSVSGKLEPGDIVSVYISLADETKDIRTSVQLPPELIHVQVLACTNADGIDITAPPDKSNLDSPLPATVTLAVDDAQAVILASSETRTGVHFALALRSGAEGEAQALLDAQAAYNLAIVQEEKDGDAKHE